MAGTGKAHLRQTGDKVLEVNDLVMNYKAGRKSVVSAVAGVSFDVLRGETLAIVGESGCGKSTLGKAILQLPRPTSGSVQLGNDELTSLDDSALRSIRPRMQMIFQDPISSLDPRLQVKNIIDEPLRVWGRGNDAEREKKVNELLTAVGLDPAVVRDRRPWEFSGGQCQRISIARSIALDPELLICDEPVSALDVSIQAQILNLLEKLQADLELSYVFIAHDLSVVRHIADEVAVMYLGKIVEIGAPEAVYGSPSHPYTQALMSAVPVPNPQSASQRKRIILTGDVPSPVNPPSGCRFRTRCPKVQDICSSEEPMLIDRGQGHRVACHFPD